MHGGRHRNVPRRRHKFRRREVRKSLPQFRAFAPVRQVPPKSSAPPTRAPIFLSPPSRADREGPAIASSRARETVRRFVGTREISNLFWLAVGDGSGKLGFFIANLYLARVLHPTNYGLLVVGQSLIYYAWQASDLGTTLYGIREVACSHQEPAECAGSLLALRIVAGATGSLICLLAVAIWPLPGTTKMIFLGACWYLFTRALYPDFVYKGLERFRALAFGSIGSGLAFAVLAVTLIHGPGQAALATLLWSFSWCTGAIVLLVYLRTRAHIRLRLSFHPRDWLPHLRQSVHFAYTGILTLIYDTLPILLIGALLGAAKLGLFSAVYRLLITLAGVSSMLAMAVYPVLSNRYANDILKFRSTHRRFRNVMLTGGVLAAALGVIFAKLIVLLLLGSQYSSAAPTFRILALDLICYSGRFIYGTALGASGHQKYYTITSLVGLAVLAGTFIPAAESLGLQGAALSVVLADAAVGSGLAYILSKKIAADNRLERTVAHIEVTQ
jgi:O-antigen/teichoic acid export membrane protein